MQDLDALIGQYARTGIGSTADLGEYHRQFMLISRYLISKNHLAMQEQSWMFLHGFPTQFSVAAATRAQASRSRARLADPDSLPSWAKPLHSVSLAGWSLAGRNASYGRLRLQLRLEAG